MNMSNAHLATQKGEQSSSTRPEFALRLYVAGQTPKSVAAFANLKRICETHLSGRYIIEVIDLLERPEIGGWRPDTCSADARPKASRTYN